MREAWLHLLLSLLVPVMWIFNLLVWGPAKYLATRMSKKLEALELALLVAGVDRRTHNEREMK